MTDTKIARVLLSHGAGAGRDSSFMMDLAEQLKRHHLDVELWDFPYMEKAKAEGKRRPPDRMPKLLDAMRSKIDSLANDLPLFLAGKSMGGRVSTLLMSELKLPTVVYGYPFHPVGKPEKQRVDHLAPCQLQVPLLILQGERDTFGNVDEVQQYDLAESVSVHWLADGDHSLKPRKASGLTQAQHLKEAARITAAFVHNILNQEHL
ncbi:alpha/beta hydrolase [Echinimonas agarilytica]|uniref:Alpha/beta hydrolase n=1 Tax=Echinimonas agarilytica TaxID=1215918 RepID=A0AA41W5F5_9GAMM|nr:alpha/beta hydrolase [Echinimonas agarilytica]